MQHVEEAVRASEQRWRHIVVCASLLGLAQPQCVLAGVYRLLLSTCGVWPTPGALTALRFFDRHALLRRSDAMHLFLRPVGNIVRKWELDNACHVQNGSLGMGLCTSRSAGGPLAQPPCLRDLNLTSAYWLN